MNVLEHRHAQVVHGSLANGDGALDLNNCQSPAEEEIREIDRADEKDPSHRGGGIGETDEIPINAKLNELWTEQLRGSGEHCENEIQGKDAAVRADIPEEPHKRLPAHRLLSELLLDQDVVRGRHSLLKTMNIQHPTSNAQHRIIEFRGVALKLGSWVFSVGVGCSKLDVGEESKKFENYR